MCIYFCRNCVLFCCAWPVRFALPAVACDTSPFAPTFLCAFDAIQSVGVKQTKKQRRPPVRVKRENMQKHYFSLSVTQQHCGVETPKKIYKRDCKEGNQMKERMRRTDDIPNNSEKRFYEVIDELPYCRRVGRGQQEPWGGNIGGTRSFVQSPDNRNLCSILNAGENYCFSFWLHYDRNSEYLIKFVLFFLADFEPFFPQNKKKLPKMAQKWPQMRQKWGLS